MWKPKNNENFWFIDRYGDVVGSRQGRLPMDPVSDRIMAFGNCFKTPQDAEIAKLRIQRILKDCHRSMYPEDKITGGFCICGDGSMEFFSADFGNANRSTPPHYQMKPEPLEVIQAWDLNFAKGSAVKYIARAGKKAGEDETTALRKAVDFLQREIKRLEAME